MIPVIAYCLISDPLGLLLLAGPLELIESPSFLFVIPFILHFLLSQSFAISSDFIRLREPRIRSNDRGGCWGFFSEHPPPGKNIRDQMHRRWSLPGEILFDDIICKLELYVPGFYAL